MEIELNHSYRSLIVYIDCLYLGYVRSPTCDAAVHSKVTTYSSYKHLALIIGQQIHNQKQYKCILIGHNKIV